MVSVLIVEDEKLIRRGLAAMLSRSSVPVEKIIEAKNGEEALAILDREPIDLMFTDIQMPQMSGLELVERIKTMEKPPIVVAVSGFDEFNYAVNMLRNGVKDYLLKPVEQEKLDQCMERLYQSLKMRKDRESSHQNFLLMTLTHYMEHGGEMDQQREKALQELEQSYLPEVYQVVCGKFANLQMGEDTLLLKGWGGLDVCICPSWDLGGEVGLVGKSRAHTGLAEIPQAYREGMCAWKQGFFADSEVEYQSLESGAQVPEVSHLMDLLRLARWQELLCTLQQGARYVAEGKLDPDRMSHLCEEMADAVSEGYRDLYDAQDEPRKYRNIWEFPSWQNYIQQLSQWLELFCQRLDQKFADYESKQKILEAVRYVRGNFCSPINMAMVSNEVSMNYSLFSVLFKQYTGKNFVTFLQNLRVDEAKRLLLETDMRVNEICAKVGFTGEKHFLKVFKASVGVSPGDFRKINRSKEK